MPKRSLMFLVSLSVPVSEDSETLSREIRRIFVKSKVLWAL